MRKTKFFFFGGMRNGQLIYLFLKKSCCSVHLRFDWALMACRDKVQMGRLSRTL